MVEPLIPSPMFGWFQPPPAFGARSTGVTPGVSASQQTDAYANALPLSALAFSGSQIVTAPSLLAAVAIKRGQPAGPTNDHEIEDFLYDALELLNGTNEVEVRCEGGRVTLTGSVPHKRLKRDIGEIAWAIPTINDVQNNVTITTRRRARSSSREGEQPSSTSSRKPA